MNTSTPRRSQVYPFTRSESLRKGRYFVVNEVLNASFIVRCINPSEQPIKKVWLAEGLEDFRGVVLHGRRKDDVMQQVSRLHLKKAAKDAAS